MAISTCADLDLLYFRRGLYLLLQLAYISTDWRNSGTDRPGSDDVEVPYRARVLTIWKLIRDVVESALPRACPDRKFIRDVVESALPKLRPDRKFIRDDVEVPYRNSVLTMDSAFTAC